MAQQKKKGSNFVKQAGILAAAGIFTRLIGILYKSPLSMVLGETGYGYYTAANEIYVMVLLISSYSIPAAISKVISQHLAMKEYKNAHRVFQCALIYVTIVGGVASLLTFFGAKALVGENTAPALKILAPTIFVSGFLGVYRGYFQAHGTMVQTAVSQIAEQIIRAVASMLFAWLFLKLMPVGKDPDIYGSAGSSLGVDLGVVTALLFMLFVYGVNRKYFTDRRKKDLTADEDLLSYQEIFKIILMLVTPMILSTFIYNCTTSLNQMIYKNVMLDVKGLSEKEAMSVYGAFTGMAVNITNIPIALASAMSSAVLPSIAGSYARNSIKEANQKIGSAIKATMFVSIPCTIGLLVIPRPITQLLYPGRATLELASNSLMMIAVTVVLYNISTISNAVLQAIGKVNIPVINAAISVVVQTIVLIPLLMYTDLGLYSLAVVRIIYSLLMCILNAIAVRKYLGYRQEVTKTFLLPVWASLIMGIVVLGVYYGLSVLLPDGYIGNALAVAAAIALGAVVYFASVLKLGVMKKEELLGLPAGSKIVKIAVKCHLIAP